MRFTSVSLAFICAHIVAARSSYDHESFADYLSKQREVEMSHVFSTPLDKEIPDPRKHDERFDPTPEQRAELDLAVRRWIDSGSISTFSTIRVPTVIHIIKETEDSTANEVIGNVEIQMDVLNEAFSSNNAGFHFDLTETQTHVNSNWWNDDGSMRSSTRVPGKNVMNVWFTELDGFLGYATGPGSAGAGDDGIVVDHKASMGGSTNNYNLGDTLVHEVGHWLGLPHTFRGGCEEPGDYVADTPAEESPAWGCPIGRDTCSSNGVDPIHNYMDYTYDSCMYEFTPGQTDRMKALWAEYRAVDTPSPTTASPTEVPSLAPSINSSDCSDSSAIAKISKRIVDKSCSDFSPATWLCRKNLKVQTHCPSTCEKCEYACVDTTAKFLFNGRYRTCAWLRNKTTTRQTRLCKKDVILTSCRATCNFCEG